jgi:hypothetical protein
MSATEALKAARDAGITVGIDGDDLTLEAAAAPPPAVLDLLARHKLGIVALLRDGEDGWSVEDWRAFFDERAGIAEFDGGMSREEAEACAFNCCVAEWLNLHPALSAAVECAWCGAAETPDAQVLPYGTSPRIHTWLHAECWSSWYDWRREGAIAALAAMGICSRPRSR